jgi:hypothetical protein
MCFAVLSFLFLCSRTKGDTLTKSKPENISLNSRHCFVGRTSNSVPILFPISRDDISRKIFSSLRSSFILSFSMNTSFLEPFTMTWCHLISQVSKRPFCSMGNLVFPSDLPLLTRNAAILRSEQNRAKCVCSWFATVWKVQQGY